jgi:sulfur carrier protein
LESPVSAFGFDFWRDHQNGTTLMQITLNGQAQAITEDLTVSGLLATLDLTGPVAVEINQNICRKADHDTTRIAPDDQIEIVTIVGGG